MGRKYQKGYSDGYSIGLLKGRAQSPTRPAMYSRPSPQQLQRSYQDGYEAARHDINAKAVAAKDQAYRDGYDTARFRPQCAPLPVLPNFAIDLINKGILMPGCTCWPERAVPSLPQHGVHRWDGGLGRYLLLATVAGAPSARVALEGQAPTPGSYLVVSAAEALCFKVTSEFPPVKPETVIRQVQRVAQP